MRAVFAFITKPMFSPGSAAVGLVSGNAFADGHGFYAATVFVVGVVALAVIAAFAEEDAA